LIRRELLDIAGTAHNLHSFLTCNGADPMRLMREMQESNQTQTAVPSGSPVVLLVEDETVVREITASVLENAGYKVLETGSAGAALDLAAQHPGRIDLLLTDVIMPEMNGIELADRILALKPDLITIFMSGYAEREIRRKMVARSAVHIQKPFTIGLLLSRVAEALGATASRDIVPSASAAVKYPAN
jgi:CheY-like chemotaxis protein